MDNCCEDKSEELKRLRGNQSRVLQIVLAVNAAMFLVEAVGGLVARSAALLGDSLDMLEDSLVYAVSLYVMDRGPQWKARAALLKGLIMLSLGIGVLGQAAYKIFSDGLPAAGTMGIIGATALAANALCFFLLYKHKSDDLNMRSTWLCSRNDVIGNFGVLGAAVLVRITRSPWPDVLVGASIAALFLFSAVGILRESYSELEGNRK